MPKIYELFGFPIDDDSPSVVESRKKITCPFMSDKCDGGGNRFMSEIHLQGHEKLAELFPEMSVIPSGVCSIQLSENSSPWIICPRRLMYMGKSATEDVLRRNTQQSLIEKCDFGKNTTIGIWAEVKVKYVDKEESSESAFDYTFDYVLMPLGRVTKTKAMEDTGLDWSSLEKMLNKNGYTFAQRDGETYIEDFPSGNPVVVEVMTSSTSGGNKKKRSCIPQAFEDCMLGKPHSAPGINYRQVWARMASQLIVKSQATIAWQGKTIWVLQDLLADYISSSTALNLHQFVADYTNEVNILAFSYGDNYKKPSKSKPVSLNEPVLYAGPIRSASNDNPKPCFQDIVLASVCPPRHVFLSALIKKTMANRLTL
jgi:hypothetical protein